MKLLLALVLCGATSCLALPKCSKEEVQSCKINDDEDILNGYCGLVRCWMEYYNTCEKSLFGPYFPNTDFNKMLSTVCVKGNPMQKKYYDNLQCITKFLQGDKGKDYDKKCYIKAKTKKEMCEKLHGKAKCTSDYITKLCGQDAGDVSQVAVAPFLVYTYSGCIPAFDPEIVI